MRLRIEPQPPPEEAQAIATAIELLLARSGSAAKKLRFSEVINESDGTYPQDCTWRDLARIEALTPGV